MTVLRLIALAGACLAAAPGGTSPAIAELTVAQIEPAPDSDPPGPIAFRVAVTARCADPESSLSIAAMLGDTLTAWQPAGADGGPFELTLAVSRRELGFETAPLCRRRAADAPTPALLPGAFTMQVFARCAAGEGRAAQRAASVPLAVRYACPEPDAAPDPEVTAPGTRSD